MNQQADSGLVVRLTLPPSANALYANRRGGRGGRIQTPEARAWKEAAGWAVKLALGGLPPPQPPYRVELFAYFDSWRRDLGNVEKATMDAIIPVLGGNDNRVVETHLYRYIDKNNPRLDVIVTTVEEYDATGSG